MNAKELPVMAIMPDFLKAVRQGRNVVLTAPPGSGKTTQAPRALLEKGVCDGAIVVVQPRRLACTTVATRVASELGVPIGDKVGYIVRYDGQISTKTKLLFVTDGVLLRLMEQDANLSWASVVIFDEFHERRVNFDLALGLLKQAQARRRGLRLVAMSATMQGEQATNYLDAVTLQADGRVYPVDIVYDEHVSDDGPSPQVISQWIAKLHNEQATGDILVFLPGKEEIRRVVYMLEILQLKDLNVLELHGELSPEDQQRVFLPSSGRKVILSTNVAETSVTVPGVRFVIDSGFERRAEFDSGLRISYLNLVRVSQASADQRAGRAGREGPGRCIRLWPHAVQKSLIKQAPVEIRQTDLASVVLTLKSLGIHSPQTFDFLDPPDPDRLEAADTLLKHLGAIGEDGQLTTVGWRMLRLPLPPRYARMVVESEGHACLNEMATIAAMMSGRPLFSARRSPEVPDPRVAFQRDPSSDFFTLLEIHHASRKHDETLEEWCKENGINIGALRDAMKLRRKIINIATSKGSFYNQHPAHREAIRRCVLVGLIDMVAIRTQGSTYRLANGMTCARDSSSAVHRAELVVAADIRRTNNSPSDGFINLLTHLEMNELLDIIGCFTTNVRLPTRLDQTTGALEVEEEMRYQSLVLRSTVKCLEAWETPYVLQEQQDRARSHQWQRVDILPGINRRGRVLWKGVAIEVITDRAGPHWASIVEGARTTIVPRERIIEIPRKQELVSGLPASLQKRITHLSPALSKLLGRD